MLFAPMNFMQNNLAVCCVVINTTKIPTLTLTSIFSLTTEMRNVPYNYTILLTLL